MIGLLTPYKVVNYGTKLQAYAVQRIFDKYENTEIIDYSPSLIDKIKRKIEKISIGYVNYSDVEVTQEPEYLHKTLEEKKRIREIAINSFDHKYKLSRHISGLYDLKSYAKNLNACVCGSDQVWNPINLYEHIYMLEFAPPSCKTIAMSASFGVENIPHNLTSLYKERINVIQHVSCREISGIKILDEMGIKAKFTLDPTALIDKNEWDILAKEATVKVDDNYIFCYFLGNHSLGREIAKYLQQITGYKIVNLPHFKGYVKWDEAFGDYDLYDVSPMDFISLIKDAHYVCTDSFHGTMFSIIYGKEFFSCPRHASSNYASTNSRLQSILEILGLEERLISDLNQICSIYNVSIDYENVYKQLKRYQTESKEFINLAMGD